MQPTRIRADEEAAAGIEQKIGSINRDRRKRIPTTIVVRPVRPPSATPVELSTKVVIVEVPKTAPTVVPIASDIKASEVLGIVPSSFIMLDFPAQAIKVPTVLNISTYKRVSVMIIKSEIVF